jgi:hypothetical protein
MDGYFKVLHKTMDYNEILDELYGQASVVALIVPVRADKSSSAHAQCFDSTVVTSQPNWQLYTFLLLAYLVSFNLTAY